MLSEQGFVVTLTDFTGSLGQLIYALKQGQQQLDKVDLLALVGQFLEYYQPLAQHDLELATETLPQVARVIEVKTRLLLPSITQGAAEEDTEPLEESLETISLLEDLEHAILFLQQRRNERQIILPARASRPHYPRTERPLHIDLDVLNQLASRLQVKSYFELAAPRLSMRDALKRIKRILKQGRSTTLMALLPVKTWEYLTIHFSAMLELIKEGEIAAEQTQVGGEIVLESLNKASKKAA